MRWLLAIALFAASCGDNVKPARDDAGVDDAATPDAPERLTGCLDRPGVDMAPNGHLPCDLIPPGLTL